MNTGNHRFRTQDILAGAVLACIGAGLFLSTLDITHLTLDLPLLHAFIDCWPLALIMGGMILLLDDHALHVFPGKAVQVSTRANIYPMPVSRMSNSKVKKGAQQ